MTYRLPDTLRALNRIVRKHSLQFSTERQAAFMLQQLLKTKFKFPPKGESCFPVLQRLEAALTGNIYSDLSGEFPSEAPRSLSSDESYTADFHSMGITPKGKRGKASRPKKPRLGITSATGFDTGLVIFCDGACEPNPGQGGWGFVVYSDGVEIHSECGGANPSTNNIMEMTGALMALRWIATMDANATSMDGKPRLLCDSQYVVKGCNEWRHGWKANGWKRGGPKANPKNAVIANLDLWKDLDEALTLVPITLEWVKGHAGTKGNERADELAAIGRQEAIEECRPQLDTPADLIEQQLRYVA